MNIKCILVEELSLDKIVRSCKVRVDKYLGLANNLVFILIYWCSKNCYLIFSTKIKLMWKGFGECLFFWWCQLTSVCTRLAAELCIVWILVAKFGSDNQVTLCKVWSVCALLDGLDLLHLDLNLVRNTLMLIGGSEKVTSIL